MLAKAARHGKTLVAIAANNARIAWALLAKGERSTVIESARVDEVSVWTEWGMTWLLRGDRSMIPTNG